MRSAKTLFAGATGAVGLGIALVALGYTADFPNPYRELSLTLGIVLIAAAAALYVASGVLLGRSQLSSPSERLEDWLYSRQRQYAQRPAVASDVPRIISIADTFIHGGASDNFKARLSARPETATIFERISGQGEIVGLFILLPLDAPTTAKIRDGRIRTGARLTERDFTRGPDKAHSLYIGGLWAAKPADRCLVVLALREVCLGLMGKNRQLQGIYANPSTKASQRLRKRFPIEPLFRDDELWGLSREDAISSGIIQDAAPHRLGLLGGTVPKRGADWLRSFRRSRSDGRIGTR